MSKSAIVMRLPALLRGTSVPAAFCTVSCTAWQIPMRSGLGGVNVTFQGLDVFCASAAPIATSPRTADSRLRIRLTMSA